MTYEAITSATKNFTRPVGVRVRGRYTRYLQVGALDSTGRIFLRSKRTDRIIASARYPDRTAIAALVAGCTLCAY